MKNIIVKLAVGVLTVFGLNACAALEMAAPTEKTALLETGWVAVEKNGVFSARYTDKKNQTVEIFCNRFGPKESSLTANRSGHQLPVNLPQMIRFETPAYTGMLTDYDYMVSQGVKVTFKKADHPANRTTDIGQNPNEFVLYSLWEAPNNRTVFYQNPAVRGNKVVIQNRNNNVTSTIYLPREYHICDRREFEDILRRKRMDQEYASQGNYGSSGSVLSPLVESLGKLNDQLKSMQKEQHFQYYNR